ncbi:hypothetical protein RRG08_024832 [Elysia crispata]|uniref:Uncharacterized protein n=1 Tax=Elysia crispata TaxID=231223 RepID=A0AAE0YJB4_9GAST|nr:hypothetical protein RRG08_024832 [Elysia crispata]
MNLLKHEEGKWQDASKDTVTRNEIEMVEVKEEKRQDTYVYTQNKETSNVRKRPQEVGLLQRDNLHESKLT